jgi:predicted nucleic acid-binding protein
VTYPNKGIICDQNIEELRRIFNRKFPQKISLLEHFFAIAFLAVEVVPTPVEESEEENRIRDVADRPILRAALSAKADILLTGDKDFLESGVINPRIMTAAEFTGM